MARYVRDKAGRWRDTKTGEWVPEVYRDESLSSGWRHVTGRPAKISEIEKATHADLKRNVQGKWYRKTGGGFASAEDIERREEYLKKERRRRKRRERERERRLAPQVTDVDLLDEEGFEEYEEETEEEITESVEEQETLPPDERTRFDAPDDWEWTWTYTDLFPEFDAQFQDEIEPSILDMIEESEIDVVGRAVRSGFRLRLEAQDPADAAKSLFFTQEVDQMIDHVATEDDLAAIVRGMAWIVIEEVNSYIREAITSGHAAQTEAAWTVDNYFFEIEG